MNNRDAVIAALERAEQLRKHLRWSDGAALDKAMDEENAWHLSPRIDRLFKKHGSIAAALEALKGEDDG